jgi:hypothetical protein
MVRLSLKRLFAGKKKEMPAAEPFSPMP